MNPADLFDATFRLFRSLAVEATIVIAFAAALHALTKSAYWRRTIWQVATLSLAALVLFETTGVARGLIAWAAPQSQARDAEPAEEPTGRAAASGRAEPQQSLDAGAPGMARPDQRFTVPMHAKSRQSHLDYPTLTRPPATLSHPTGEDRGEGASRFTPPIQVKQAAPLTVPSEPPLLWWLGLVWILGMVAVLARVALGRCLLCLFCRCRRGHADPVLGRCVEALARRMGIRRRVRVIVSAGLSGPIAFGTFRPTIGLPQNSDFSPVQQEVMLAHELAHLAAHDPLWHLLAEAVSAALWWHPLAWWMRHQLHAASESAADEASLLLDDGPSVLAECLVELGGRLPQRAPLAWMRIEGNGFRSGLGRRVEQLLKLDGHAWQPRARVRSWLAKTVGPALLVVVAVVAAARTQPGDFGPENSIRGAVENSWRNSLASSALFALVGAEDSTVAVAAKQSHKQTLAQTKAGEATARDGARSEPAASPDFTDRKYMTTLATDAVIFYQDGKLTEAEARLRQAIKEDPENKLALHYLALIAEARRTQGTPGNSQTQPNSVFVGTGQALNPPTNASARTNQVSTGPGRNRISSQLAEINIHETPAFDGVPLSQIVTWLREESRKLDRDERGINFMIANRLDNADPSAGVLKIDPQTGRPILLPPKASAADLKDVKIQLPPLDHLRLADVLEAICKAADQPIKYSVEEYAVVFSYRTPEPVKLYTRTYRVDPNTFVQALQKFQAQNSGAGQTGQTNNPPLREFFSAFGADFRTNAVDFKAVGQRRAVFFNDGTGVLFVRATQQELDTIDQAMQVLNLAPPQVLIEVRLAEIAESDSKALGFDRFPVNPAEPSGQKPTRGLGRQQTNAAVAVETMTGIMTDPQFRAVIKTLEQRSGADILTAPRVTTLSGRQAEVKVVETRTVVTGAELDTTKKDPKAGSNGLPHVKYKTSPMEFGPIIDVLPSVRADGYSIQMEVKAGVKEFLGYDDPRSVKVPELSKQYQEPLPRYRTREITGNAIVWDGQTVVLVGPTSEEVLRLKDKVPVLGDIPLMGRLFRHESTSTVRKRLIVFLTPTIVDPAGNRVHAGANLPYDPNTASAQPPR